MYFLIYEIRIMQAQTKWNDLQRQIVKKKARLLLNNYKKMIMTECPITVI